MQRHCRLIFILKLYTPFRFDLLFDFAREKESQDLTEEKLMSDMSTGQILILCLDCQLSVISIF